MNKDESPEFILPNAIVEDQMNESNFIFHTNLNIN